MSAANKPPTPKTAADDSAAVPPADWCRTSMGQIGSTYGGLTGKVKADFGRGGAKYITFLNVLENARIDPDLFEAVDIRPGELQNLVLQGDLLFNGTSETPEDVALAAVLQSEVPCLFLNSFCFGFRISDREGHDASFLAYFFRGPTGRQLMSALAQGATRYNISKRQFLRLSLELPPPPEQRAIAEALSDVDGLLRCLEALIAKKRAIKQAAMQQLLTGNTRLPGFRGPWETKRLGDLATMGSGGTPLSSVAAYYDGDIPWVSISDMTKGGKVLDKTDRNLTALGYANCAAQMFPAGTILYAMYASLGECSIAGVPVCTSQAILGIETHSELNSDFLYYFLTSLKSKVKTLGQQGTQANLNKGMVQDFQLPLPLPSEQTAIATVLSDMDDEIAALERRRDKTRAIKQGMMQQLLTGRVRLEEPTPAEASA